MNDEPTPDGADAPEPDLDLDLDLERELEPVLDDDEAIALDDSEDVVIVAPAPAVEAFATVVEPADLPIEAAPPVDAGAPVLEAIGRLGDDLGKRLDALQAAFERELRAESSREKVVDRLHAELQEYKNDLLLKVLKPVFVDLIQLHDDMGKMAEALEDDRTSEVLRDFQLSVEDVLYRQGVEPYAVEGDAFDPRRQRAVSTVATDDPSLSKTIAERLRKGFASGDRVIRPELVSVFAAKRG